MNNISISSVFMPLLVLLVYTVSSVSGLTLIKASTTSFSIPFVAGAALYGGGFLMWIFLILKMLPLSVGFPLASGMLIVGTQISGFYFLKESMSTTHLIGVGLIMAGICFIYASGDMT